MSTYTRIYFEVLFASGCVCKSLAGVRWCGCGVCGSFMGCVMCVCACVCMHYGRLRWGCRAGRLGPGRLSSVLAPLAVCGAVVWRCGVGAVCGAVRARGDVCTYIDT